MSVGTKIRFRRRQLSLTLEAVAQSSGLSKPFLSQIERDKATPSLTSLARIAEALQMSMDYFVSPPLPDEAVQRASERRFFSLDNSAKQFAPMTVNVPQRQLEALLTRLPPGSVSEVTTHAGEEFFYVLQGQLSMTVGDQEFEITAGDSAHYQSTTPHRWENRGSEEAVLVWVGTPKLL